MPRNKEHTPGAAGAPANDLAGKPVLTGRARHEAP
jgi:hypothetical protein